MFKSANDLMHLIEDQIMREMMLGFRKDGSPSNLDARARQAIIDEYEDMPNRLIGKSDEQIAQIITRLEAFQARISAQLVEKP